MTKYALIERATGRVVQGKECIKDGIGTLDRYEHCIDRAYMLVFYLNGSGDTDLIGPMHVNLQFYPDYQIIEAPDE